MKVDTIILCGFAIFIARWVFIQWDHGRYRAGFPGRPLWTLPDGSPRLFMIKRRDDGSTHFAHVVELPDKDLCWQIAEYPHHRYYDDADEMLILGWREFPGA